MIPRACRLANCGYLASAHRLPRCTQIQSIRFSTERHGIRLYAEFRSKTGDGEVCWQKPERKLARSFENFDPELERLIMPFDVPDQIMAKLNFVTFTQDLGIEFL
jgi:hypothetical protein